MITGEFFIACRAVSGRDTYRALDAATGATLEPAFHAADAAAIDQACEAAAHAFDAFRARGLGGPFPATSDSRMTSVGSLAIERFLRPVCYQDLPPELLPEVLRDGEGRFERLVDGARVGPTALRD
jgi:hypothetical protein